MTRMRLIDRLARCCGVFLLAVILPCMAQAQSQPTHQRQAQPQTLDRIVAVVNEGVITQHQLDARTRSATAQLHRQKVQLPPRKF